MNNKKFTAKKIGSFQGFTLIELLVVIAIIAVLASIAFVSYGGIIKTAKKKAAQAVCVDIVAALKQYKLDYGRYLLNDPSSPPTGDLDFSTDDSDAVLALLGDDTSNGAKDINPRQESYLEMKPSEDGTTDGLTASNAIADPWGGFYHIRQDTDYDNKISQPSVDTATAPFTSKPATEDMRIGIAVWSMGDTSDPDWSSDEAVTSWK